MTVANPPITTTPAIEQERLLELRARYQQDRGLFSRSELARLLWPTRARRTGGER